MRSRAWTKATCAKTMPLALLDHAEPNADPKAVNTADGDAARKIDLCATRDRLASAVPRDAAITPRFGRTSAGRSPAKTRPQSRNRNTAATLGPGSYSARFTAPHPRRRRDEKCARPGRVSSRLRPAAVRPATKAIGFAAGGGGCVDFKSALTVGQCPAKRVRVWREACRASRPRS